MSFKTENKDTYILVTCPKHMDTRAVPDFAAEAVFWEEAEKPVIFDFTDVELLSDTIFRSFVLFQQNLKKKKIHLFTINIHKREIIKTIMANGLDSVFNPKINLDEALKSLGGTEHVSHMDVGFLNPFLVATQKTLEVQANTKVNVGRPRLKEPGEKLNADIAGVINLQSNVFEGSISLCFPAKVFLSIYSNMVGEKHETISKEIADAAGELMNIIFGQAKMELNDKHQYQIQKAIPTVVLGNDFQVLHMNRNTVMLLPFETEVGGFFVEISINPVHWDKK